MEHSEGLEVLASLHDRGMLVPFIGSGISMGPCASWEEMLIKLEVAAGLTPGANVGDLIARAEAVMQVLRHGGYDIPETIRSAVYVDGKRDAPTHSDALARLRWPLICTTNYDDVYLRAALRLAEPAHRRAVPQVRGRAEGDCRSVLQHLALPVGELVWALQGFLTPEPYSVEFGTRPKTTLRLEACRHSEPLAREIVLSHSEYRGVTHRAPHFRRAFAEVFRSRSFLFLGSGLTESYFRSLFDEVIELIGPPARPHFALIPKGSLDREFMRIHYHMICMEYDEACHSEVSRFLNELADLVKQSRAGVQAWGWKVPTALPTGPVTTADTSALPDFTIVRASPPLSRETLRPTDIVGISCGRKVRKTKANEPLPGSRTKAALGAILEQPRTWIGDYLVSWQGSATWLRGIVARETGAESSRVARSPGAVLDAFERFLEDAYANGKQTAYVQLLSVGSLKTFESWISLVQMARAYGRWIKSRQAAGKDALRVIVHVRDDEIVALLNGGFLDISEHLADSPLRLFVEVIDVFGQTQRQHAMVDARSELRRLPVLSNAGSRDPALHAVPAPRKDAHPVAFASVADVTVSSFGLVSGSTLVVDYRPISGSPGTQSTPEPALALGTIRTPSPSTRRRSGPRAGPSR